MFTKKTLPWTVIPFVSHDHLGGLLQEIPIIIAENSGIFHPPQKKHHRLRKPLICCTNIGKDGEVVVFEVRKKKKHPTCCSDFEHVDVGEISEIRIRCKPKFLPKIKSPQHSCSPPRHWSFWKTKTSKRMPFGDQAAGGPSHPQGDHHPSF